MRRENVALLAQSFFFREKGEERQWEILFIMSSLLLQVMQVSLKVN
jgi:hypothetical protein